MTPADIATHVERLKVRFADLEERLADPTIYSNHVESRKVSSEHQKLGRLFKSYDRWTQALKEIEENKLLLQEDDGSDDELSEMVALEIEELEKEVAELEFIIQAALLPPDPNEGRNTIVEIRPAAGGDEAALFAGELYRAYTRFAEMNNWKIDVLEVSMSDLGGIKNAVFSLSGDDIFGKMKYESGVHRVQRIPSTESGGRIHTSTITVSVLPEAEEVELDLKQEDLRIDTFRSSGPGGQCVNTTDSAVRITHLPTGVTVVSQQEKSQHKNREIAIRILCARLLEKQQQEEQLKLAADKRAQVGTGDRSERIRTYNYPQNRVTDHRYGITIYDLPKIMEGSFDILLNPIITVDCERRLEELSAGEE